MSCSTQVHQQIFIHTINEALNFDKQLRNEYKFNTISTVSGLISEQLILDNWITIDKRSKLECIQVIKWVDTAQFLTEKLLDWSLYIRTHFQDVYEEDDELKPSNAVHALISTLHSLNGKK